MFSQNDEELIILQYFKNLHLLNGKLLDIGAFDGELFSNTRKLMLEFTEWSGVFVEPSSFSFSKLAALYENDPQRVTLVNAAVVEENKIDTRLLKFYDYPNSTVSSLTENHTKKYGYEEKNIHGHITKPYKVYVGQIGLNEILTNFGPFDFINIDVEGQSADIVLQEWFNPFNYNCKLICVEHDKKEQLLIDKFTQIGYKIITCNTENIIASI